MEIRSAGKGRGEKLVWGVELVEYPEPTDMSPENDWQGDVPEDSSDGESVADDSPYEPPDASVTGAERADETGGGSPPIYSPAGVGIGTFFGGPVAATVLLYLNFSKLGWNERAKMTLVLGTLATLAAFGLAVVVPSGGGTGLTVGWIVASIWIARHYQDEVEEQYTTVSHRSNWHAAGVGCLSLLGAAAVIVAAVFLFGVPSV